MPTKATPQSLGEKAQALADEANAAGIRPSAADDRPGRVFTAEDMKKIYKVGQRRTVTVRGVTWTQVFTADGEWWNIDLAL